MARYISILSGKGGVGKSTTSINLGGALNYFGRNVIIVDGNMTTPNVGLQLGVPIVPISLHNALQGKNHITEAVYLHPSGTKIVPGGISIKDLKNTKPDNLRSVLKGLNKHAEFIIIDGAAGLGRESLAVIDAADDVVIVTNPELPAITDALKTIKVCEELGKDVIGVILTRTKENNLDISVNNIKTMLEKPIIGIIPEDKSVREALNMKDIMVYTHPKSRAALSYKKLAADLIGQKYEPESEKDGFFTRIKKALKLK